MFYELDLFQDMALLEKALDVKGKRNEVIANNIANADVPGFKRSKVVFEDLLQSHLKSSRLSMSTSRSRHFLTGDISSIEPKIIAQDDRIWRNDGNNVDIEKEMVEAVKNAYSYNITVDQASRKFRILQSAINEGRR